MMTHMFPTKNLLIGEQASIDFTEDTKERQRRQFMSHFPQQ